MPVPNPAAVDVRPRRSMQSHPGVVVVALVALAAVTAGVLARPDLGVPLLVCAVVAMLVGRSMRDDAVSPDTMATLDAWLATIDAATPTAVIAAGALTVARELSGGGAADIVLFREGVGWRLCQDRPDADDAWQPLPQPVGQVSAHADVAQGAVAVRVRRLRRDETSRATQWRAELLRGLRAPALALPFRGSIARGVLVVAEPFGRGIAAGFTRGAEVRLRVLTAHLASVLDTAIVTQQVHDAAKRQMRTSTIDTLTGLPNRAVFVERVDDAARISSPQLLSAVLLVNLNRFREINATFGHHVGDRLLCQFGARMRDSLPVTATVARLGGDEFAVLLCEVPNVRAVRRIAGELLDDLAVAYTVDGADLQLEASMGIALAPLHADDAVALLQRADIAMEGAKSAHRGVELYDRDRGTHDGSHLRMLADLRRAIDTDELSIVYQPKAGLRTHDVSGAEALLRWDHPTHGRVSPGEFIPIAERTGLIHPLTRWVLRTVVAQQRRWRDAGIQIEVAVNLSARNLLDDTLPAQIAHLLAEHALPPHTLRLEITESSLIVDPGRAEAIIAELHALGLSLSVDDFGTGYSSLAHLLRLPVDEIKVDRSFVSGLVARRNEAAIVHATVDLGRRLSITVTAEGVEDLATWDKLTEMGCDVAQGFWFARPMDALALERWLLDFDRTSVAGRPSPGGADRSGPVDPGAPEPTSVSP